MAEKTSESAMRIGVVGGGSWGTALANLLAQKGYAIDLWVYESELIERINQNRENSLYLPGARLSHRLTAVGNIEQVVQGKDLILNVVPSHLVRSLTQTFASFLGENTILISASKGIENETFLTMSQVFKDVIPALKEGQIAVLSGPSFAKEVVAGLATAVSIASSSLETAQTVQTVFSTPQFRAYTNNDVIGVELGGAVKNVIALAAGIIDGLQLGLNTRAALITRGQTEIRRLGLKMNANPRTFTGLAGMGDLILTCTGDLSRNHKVGRRIGQGDTLETILADMHMVAEGVKTARSVYNLSNKLNVEMPICHAVYKVLYEGLPPSKALQELMTRDLKYEFDEV
jgi:glycerol-3-phosphate dehydrogenase (NAD(P)+)